MSGSASDAPKPVLDRFAAERCSAILRTRHAAAAEPAMRAAVDGGFRIVEFTMNTPHALDHVRTFARERELLVGAGTVLSVDDAKAAADAGARFLVSPVADPDVIGWCVANDLVAIPGTATPTEAFTAWRLGAPILKIFPGPASGPDWIRAVRGPLPFLRLFPTSGVDVDNAPDYLAAGAFGVGFVNCLFEPYLMEKRDFRAIQRHAETMTTTVRGAPRLAESSDANDDGNHLGRSI
jgi:2-dehydro-3-deoxyphosphogluconate aldolase/(4S)-4-hydroxy-2-oxoglutarate aldolase